MATRLAALEPAIRFQSLSFDWRHPDLTALAGHGDAVVFTVHSLEQVPDLDAGALDAVLALAPSVTCLHFESVGWQLEGDSASSSRVVQRWSG